MPDDPAMHDYMNNMWEVPQAELAEEVLGVKLETVRGEMFSE